ncbi:cob(I)yrinic acid a,c-diamide adenosyltransferase [Bacteroidetes/Chlorobi group bacterium ChocPot_Mid]|jgi:cob(I)alamin adenosyltransferase|nr:MAG: cob(I)yrinic acid a,c-diamide adenosyltransferase [Bacteroidetes/Chlorobi group bacterium ChocPot_Mid]
MKIYTKTGDKGSTSLYNGNRVQKSDLRVETYGTVDELNTIIGIVIAHDVPKLIEDDLLKISKWLFNLGSDLATPLDSKINIQRIQKENIEYLEKKIDEYTIKLPELKNFILPGGSKPGAFLHQARTVCRRAERLAVSLSEKETIGELPVIFLNRLSDYLFTAARFSNHLLGINETIWTK